MQSLFFCLLATWTEEDWSGNKAEIYENSKEIFTQVMLEYFSLLICLQLIRTKRKMNKPTEIICSYTTTTLLNFVYCVWLSRYVCMWQVFIICTHITVASCSCRCICVSSFSSRAAGGAQKPRQANPIAISILIVIPLGIWVLAV